ncbi:WhiB family transcriptional regulator [Streptomyces spongiae]|uniref:Transcriptional regulator WhiB n=1 Tax=Streptomyces spongiae TaxID=565072 RepID=A0A5N8XI86_9ACTN|nr:WhiB family transcriptional regulator [Streptomyces spongiae]MPY59182.1 WhiB family transcriptional regulator [Streptomyces spongiae]
MEWLRSAACVGEDPDLFFPVGTSGPALRDIAAAKRVCSRCPVISQCLSWALSSRQLAGVWGGLCEEERAALLRIAGPSQNTCTARHKTTRRSNAR